MKTFVKNIADVRSNSFVKAIADLWNKGPAHQTWLGLAGALLAGAVIALALREFCEAAKLVLTAVAMVVIML